MNDKNKLLQKRYDLQQTRADHLEVATKAYESGDMTGYNSAMEKVGECNKSLETLVNLIAECEKTFQNGDPGTKDESSGRASKAGKDLVDAIRGTEKYASAWLKSIKDGIQPEKGSGIDVLSPLYEAERAAKAMTIGGGDPVGMDGGFLVPVDFDNRVNELLKEYIDLSNLITVERVNVNSGWRVIDTTGSRTPLTLVDEMGTIKVNEQPKFTKLVYECKKYADKLIVSNELMADASGLIRYLAGWWAPKYVLTKNKLIMALLTAQTYSALSGSTDAEQIKAMKTLINTGLNTAHSKRATILTNASGYNIMDNWAETSGRPMLIPDPKGGDFSRFKGRPVLYADDDLIPNKSDTEHPYFIGDFKAFARMFLRQGTRIRSTDIGGAAWDTDSTEIRCTCRMDCRVVDAAAIKYTGITVAGG